ncbi:glycerophosphoryl diester phosphodiesterase [Austwickia chelonae]|uniref:Putative glycerophosphoryl diester phosphodiesterase n=1 Tax=Austwickia chelonae NBRC 105200 TaxID=1184607 RepID=K6V4X0_9MICO|nr:glycerophosphodiester phosphodiesterase family protein [Austwickia chelonae]GAB77228.1 putative glycerophosphoryl diester phosphodiesterase [Austwickia chelonae NBRC 105200]SEW05626.1 glycerophosphoryl diester phosphodiesterase [Austwickia chelonae]
MAVRGPWHRGHFDIQAHAGAQGYYVGNTWSAFEDAVHCGSMNMELDVRVTKDGVPVVWHDMEITPREIQAWDQRLYGRRIDELTFDQLQQVEVGGVLDARFPRQRRGRYLRMLGLADLFNRLSRLSPEIWFTVEIKLESFDPLQAARRRAIVDAVLEAVDAARVRERVTMHSFDWECLRLITNLAPDLPRSALVAHGETWLPGSIHVGENTYDLNGGDAALAAYRLGAHAIAPRLRDEDGRIVVDRALIDRAHALGLAVVPWTVDVPGEQTALIRAGVDGIVTNYPEQLRGVTIEPR